MWKQVIYRKNVNNRKFISWILLMSHNAIIIGENSPELQLSDTFFCKFDSKNPLQKFVQHSWGDKNRRMALITIPKIFCTAKVLRTRLNTGISALQSMGIVFLQIGTHTIIIMTAFQKQKTQCQFEAINLFSHFAYFVQIHTLLLC